MLIHYEVLYTDLSSEKPDQHVCKGNMVISGSLGDIVVSTLAQNIRDVSLIHTQGVTFPIFITPPQHCMTMILYMLYTLLLNLLCVCIHKVIAYMYVIVSIKRLTI